VPLTHLECTRCGKRFAPGAILNLCDCGGPLFARYDLERAAKNMRPGHLALREPTLWRYDDVLPVGSSQAARARKEAGDGAAAAAGR